MRTIKAMSPEYAGQVHDVIYDAFCGWRDEEEGKMVCRLVEEIRSKRYYLPRLELIMVDETDSVLGYAMFSRFHLEGKFEDKLLILTPVAVKPEVQRQHISRDLIEYGFEQAKAMGFDAVIVEGNPANYRSRGFVTSAEHGILAGPNVHLPAVECLMVKELVPGALGRIKGLVDYSCYETLT